jgi:hypothetical protein
MPRYALVGVTLVGVLVACVLAGASVINAAFSQDSHGVDRGWHGQGHSENHDWYKELKQPGTGFACCNGTINGVEGDCRPTRAYLNDDGHWYALLDGRWILVPPRAVLKQLAPDGSSHICASKSGMIFCFLGGSPKI